MWIDRLSNKRLREVLTTFPAVLLTGARQTGKSTLLTHELPQAESVTLDRVAVAMEAEENPQVFMRRFEGQVILDEVQYAPSLFRELKIHIDQARHQSGRWVLTGSQKFNLMGQASESLAGRVGLLSLETLSARELRESGHFSGDQLEDFLWKGGYPELWANCRLNPHDFFESYIQTYLERDLRAILKVGNSRDFQRLIRLVALRAGQLVNYSELSKEVGVAVNTVKSWLGALEAGGLLYLLPSYWANIGKRLIKAPKLYFADHGLLAYLLGIVDRTSWQKHPLRGQVWENLVFGELVKTLGAIPGRHLFFYRDQNGVEIDFIWDRGPELVLIEAKATEVPNIRKLNFAKVQPLFTEVEVRCWLTAPTPESVARQWPGFVMLNPMLTNLKDTG
jgi:predicted AAA+ superfamily ATPase